MADKEDGATAGGSQPEQGPLVSVTFQKNPAQKQKYLEAQPKELGITQIGLSLHQLTWVSVLLSHETGRLDDYIKPPFIVASIVVMVAGCVAIAARSLHIPTLRACLVMQLFAIVASAFNMILMLMQFDSGIMRDCWYNYDLMNGTTHSQFTRCKSLEHAYGHCYSGGTMVQVALLAIAVTLTAYCCKVVNCCSVASKMPVITVQAPPNPAPDLQAKRND